MTATPARVFALKNSGFEAFLYADVGEEPNGSALTILSMIARLGRDPWEEAAGMATLSRPAAIERLAQSIEQMPLVRSAAADTRTTAARLVALLPAAASGARRGCPATPEPASMPRWVPITMLYCALAVGMALNALWMTKPTQLVEPPTGQALIAPGAVAGPLADHTVDATARPVGQVKR